MTVTEHTVTPDWVNVDKLIDPELRDSALQLAKKIDKAHAKLEDTFAEAMRVGTQIEAHVARLSDEYDVGAIPSDECLREVIAGLAGWTQLNAALGSLSDATNIEERLRSNRFVAEIEERVAVERAHPDLPASPSWLTLARIVTDTDRVRAIELAQRIASDTDASLSDGTIAEARGLYCKIDRATYEAMREIPEPGPLAPDARHASHFESPWV